MAYKQKAEDLQNISRAMKDKASYGPGGGDPPAKTKPSGGSRKMEKIEKVTKGDKDVAKDIVEAKDPTEGMDKLEKAYYQKQIGSKKLDQEGKYMDEQGNYRDGKTDKILPYKGVKDERLKKQYLAVQNRATP